MRRRDGFHSPRIPPSREGLATMEYIVPGDSPAVSRLGIHMANSSSNGTGTFSASLNPGALAATSEPFAPRIVTPLVFGIMASVNPGKGILAAIYGKDGKKPKHKLGFHLPANINPHVPHELVVEFAAWRIVSVSIDRAPLASMDAESSH